MNRTKQQSGDAECEPQIADMSQKFTDCSMWFDGVQQRWIREQEQRRQRPDRQENNLPAQIVADLDRFLVFVGNAIDEIIALGLEEQVPDLPADHGYQPSGQGCRSGILEYEDVGAHEAHGAEQMEGLIYSAVMIIPMI